MFEQYLKNIFTAKPGETFFFVPKLGFCVKLGKPVQVSHDGGAVWRDATTDELHALNKQQMIQRESYLKMLRTEIDRCKTEINNGLFTQRN